MKNIKLFSSLLIICAVFLALSGCKKEEEAGLALPPASSMVMDFSFTKKKSAPMTSDSANYSNYFIARTGVTFWALAAAINTAIPVFAFKTAISNKPVYNNTDNAYIWSFNFKFASDNYIAALKGQINLEEDSVTWQMKMTKVNEGIEFKWYEGKSAMDRSGGWWILYNPALAGENKQALKINWLRDNDTDGVLRYTNIITDDENNGAYIEFGSDANSNLDKYFSIYIKKDDANPGNNEKTYTIQWCSTNNNGYISDGSNQYCWDKNYLNTTCQ